MSDKKLRESTSVDIREYVYPRLYITQGQSQEEGKSKDYHILVHTALRQRYKGAWYLTHRVFRVSIAEAYITGEALVYVALQTIGEQAFRAITLDRVDPNRDGTIVDPSQATEKERLQLLADSSTKMIEDAKKEAAEKEAKANPVVKEKKTPIKKLAQKPVEKKAPAKKAAKKPAEKKTPIKKAAKAPAKKVTEVPMAKKPAVKRRRTSKK